MGGGYKEDPADKAARFRERRITDLARNKASQETASGLSSDIRAVYGMKGLTPVVGTATKGKAKNTWGLGIGNISTQLSDTFNKSGN